MTLPKTKSEGPIVMSQVRLTFGGEIPDRKSEYYKGGAYVSASETAPIPTSGEFPDSAFYGAGEAVAPSTTRTYDTPGLVDIYIPNYATSLTIECYGGGGSSGESAYDGTIIGDNTADAQGYDGVPGLVSTVVLPGGTITPSDAQTRSSSKGPFSHVPDPVVRNALITANGGGAGAGWKGRAYKGQPVSPDGADGEPGGGGVADQTDRDTVTPGGGAAGGIKAGYLGQSTNRGGSGGPGGYAKKVHLKTDADAPLPGTTRRAWVGRGGEVPQHHGAQTAGMNGRIVVTAK